MGTSSSDSLRKAEAPKARRSLFGDRAEGEYKPFLNPLIFSEDGRDTYLSRLTLAVLPELALLERLPGAGVCSLFQLIGLVTERLLYRTRGIEFLQQVKVPKSEGGPVKHRIAKLFLATSILPSLLLSALLVLSATAAGQESSALSLETHILLPNVKGRIDHFSVDVKGQRLFVAAVDNHTLEVVDLKSGQRVHTITDLAEPQGVFYDSSTNRLFVACGLDGVTKIFDGTTFQVLATVKFPDDADNIRYDARSKGVIVGYAGAKQLRKRKEGTGGLGFLDSNGTKTGDIVIDAHPESFQLEEAGTRLFVNVPEKKEIEVIDLVRRTVQARWPVTAQNNFPMALDEAHHRLFVGCWVPPRLLVFDTETGKEVASSEIAGSTDDLFYDPSRGRIYVLTSQGFLEVFQQKNSVHYDRIARYPTPVGTQTGLFVPEWGKLFAAVRKQREQSAEVRVYQAH